MDPTRVALSAALIVALACGTLLYQPRWLVRMVASRSPDVLYFVETERPLVALTIDDGPDPETTPDILRALARYETRATFFLISGRIAGAESIVERIVDAGHELGNHMTRDEPSIALSRAEFERSMLAADELLSSFGTVRWLRPGSGWHNDMMVGVARDHDYRLALGSVYAYDAQIPSVRYAAWQVLKSVRPGAVIVVHDGGKRGARTTLVLDEILPELARRGLSVVTLSELVAAGSY